MIEKWQVGIWTVEVSPPHAMSNLVAAFKISGENRYGGFAAPEEIDDLIYAVESLRRRIRKARREFNQSNNDYQRSKNENRRRQAKMKAEEDAAVAKAIERLRHEAREELDK